MWDLDLAWDRRGDWKSSDRKLELGLRVQALVAFALLGLVFMVPFARADGPVPVGPEIEVATGFSFRSNPSIAATNDGSFIVAWTQSSGMSGPSSWTRFFSGSGFPAGPAIRIVGSDELGTFCPQVSPLPSTGYVAAWIQGDLGPQGWWPGELVVGRLDAEGRLLEILRDSETGSGCPILSVDSAGRIAVGWYEDDSNRVKVQILDSSGEPLIEPIELEQGFFYPSNTESLLLRQEDLTVAWTVQGRFGLHKRLIQRFYLDGSPIGPSVWYDTRYGDLVDMSASSSGLGLVARNLGLGGPQDGPYQTALARPDSIYDPIVTTAPGEILADVSVGGISEERFIIGGVLTEEEEARWPEVRAYDSEGVALGEAARLATKTLTSDQWSRSKVELATVLPIQMRDVAVATWIVPIATVGTDPIYEIAARRISPPCVEDAQTLCLGPDNRFRLRSRWTDFEGQEGVGQAEERDRDWGTFWFFSEDNLELAVKVLDGQPVNGNHWVFYASLSNVEYELEVLDTLTGHIRLYQNGSGEFASVGDDAAFPGDSGLDVARVDEASIVLTPKEDLPSPDCEPSEQRLCLLDGRFAVEVTWEAFDGRTGVGGAIPLTSDTGELWFFRPGNPELLVKVLDGGGINGHFWVFYGALTNVAFEMTVRDTVTGAEQTYSNPLDNFASVGDVVAFPR